MKSFPLLLYIRSGIYSDWFILQGLFFQQNKLTLPFLHTFPLRFFQLCIAIFRVSFRYTKSNIWKHP